MPVYLKDIDELTELESFKAVKTAPCQVFQGMRSEGIMSIQPHFHPPCTISLELNNVTPLVHQAKHSLPWVAL